MSNSVDLAMARVREGDGDPTVAALSNRIRNSGALMAYPTRPTPDERAGVSHGERGWRRPIGR